VRQRSDWIFSVTGSTPAASFAHRVRACVAYANVLAGFMSKGPTPVGFGSTWCVGGVGYWAGLMEW